MQFQRLIHSLRFRLTVTVTLALILILGAATLWRYNTHRDMDLEEARTQATAASDMLLASMQYALRANNANDLHAIVDKVSQQPSVRGIYLFDSGANLKLYRQTGPAVSLPNAKELAAGMSAPNDSSSQSIVYTAPGGEQTLRHTNFITNQPDCFSCHSAQQQVLGALVSDFALTETNYQITTDLQGSITSGIATILAVVLVINVLLSRFVLNQLEQFIPLLQRFGKGDLAVRLAPTGTDEIGQLATGFNQMADGLQTRERENARLYTELEHKEAARTFLLGKVIAAQEEEHKRLARELHDDLAQSLTALSITVQSAVETIPADMAAIHQRLENVQRLTQDTLLETSRWIQDLRPQVLDDLGLVPAIRAYAEARFEGSGTRVQIETNNLAQRLPPQVEITLFRVLQEALSNIAKHAQAQNVLVRIDRYASGTIVAHVQDDGVGFLPAKYLRAQDGMRGFGLLGMRERVALLDGTLTIDSTPGRGTRLRAEVPWKERMP